MILLDNKSIKNNVKYKESLINRDNLSGLERKRSLEGNDAVACSFM
jgi:hypothetical protein